MMMTPPSLWHPVSWLSASSVALLTLGDHHRWSFFEGNRWIGHVQGDGEAVVEAVVRDVEISHGGQSRFPHVENGKIALLPPIPGGLGECVQPCAFCGERDAEWLFTCQVCGEPFCSQCGVCDYNEYVCLLCWDKGGKSESH